MTKQNDKIKKDFRIKLLEHIKLFNSAVSANNGDWIVKGFIDIAKNIYTISVDTKVISKIMELLLFPQICRIAKKMGCKIVLCKEQNSYPDITFIDRENNKFAIDIKSTYRINEEKVNGMTLGAFTGYFRYRDSKKNTTFSYNEYAGHFVLGIIYSRNESGDERKVYKLNDLQNITSVIKDFTFFVQEKYRIAADNPGSGNTKNIGSLKNIDKLVNGRGVFSELGEDVFDDYWMYYLTKDMAKAADLKGPPYKNITEYKKYKKMK